MVYFELNNIKYLPAQTFRMAIMFSYERTY